MGEQRQQIEPDSRGSRWSRWDLHVHTPVSFANNYGGNTDEAWERFISEIEALPPEFAVLGINDYLSVAGYDRLLREKAEGRLANIRLMLPVIELRLDKFGGTAGSLSRVNYHIIFSDQLTPADIQQQFINLLVREYRVDEGSVWREPPTDAGLERLGNMIIGSVPEDRRKEFGPPIVEGYNNLNFPLELIEKALNNSFLKGKYFTAVGKTEWADVKWNDQSIAEKKHVIECADFVFIATDSAQHCENAKRSLTSAGVNDRLLDCSDAHDYTTSDEKDRIGHCYTWVKADPTFEGLRQVRHAHDARVYLGNYPPKLALVEKHPTKFIRSLTVRRLPESTLKERWFDNTIAFNHDLVAVIGNKGMGKSALADILAILGNTDVDPSSLSFLTEKRFRDRKNNKAKQFEATLTWESGGVQSRVLDQLVPEGVVPQVRYIPQHFFERLCNETGNAELLQKELRKVIFGNLPIERRGGFSDLESLIEMRTGEAARRIDELRGELSAVNRDVVRLEEELSRTRRTELEDELRQKKSELAALREPAPVPQPVDTPQTIPELDTARTQLATIEERIGAERERLAKAYDRKANVERLIARFRAAEDWLARLRTDTTAELESLGLSFNMLFPAKIRFEPLEKSLEDTTESILTAETLLSGAGGLEEQEETVRRTLVDLQEALDAPAKAHQEYLTARQDHAKLRAELVGTKESPGSIAYLEWRLKEGVQTLTAELGEAKEAQVRIARDIHRQLVGIRDFLRTLYESVDTYLREHPVVSKQLAVEFAAELRDEGFGDELMKLINRNRSGAFSEESAVFDLMSEISMDDEDQLIDVLTDAINMLHHKADGTLGDIEDLRRQLKKGINPENIYELLFGLEYLAPRYALKVKGRDITQLTPGERGSLLLVFYLLIDRDDRPLIIDQPEENLDNQSVYELLVPCIAEAKERRQIIVVTHNPNLAVVCNAEQVVWCRIEKDTDYAVRYESGGLENLEINKHVVDVLEGTAPAFENRSEKYDVGS